MLQLETLTSRIKRYQVYMLFFEHCGHDTSTVVSNGSTDCTVLTYVTAYTILHAVVGTVMTILPD